MAVADAQGGKQAAAVNLQPAQQEVVACQDWGSTFMQEGVAWMRLQATHACGGLVAGGTSAWACPLQTVYTTAAHMLAAGFRRGSGLPPACSENHCLPSCCPCHVACTHSQEVGH